jgi:hypothetical protein
MNEITFADGSVLQIQKQTNGTFNFYLTKGTVNVQSTATATELTAIAAICNVALE